MVLVSAPPFSSSTTISNSLFLRRQLHHHQHLQLTFASSPPLHISKFCTLYRRRSSLSFIKETASKVSYGQAEVEDSLNDEACELVSGMEVLLGEGADSVRGYLLKAVKNNNGTGILLLSDIFGFEDSSTREFAYRVACNGYNVLVPDLFRGNPWAKNMSRALFEEWIAGHNLQRVLKDIATSTKWMIDEFIAAGISKKLGIIGFCYGGGRVLDALAQDEDACFGTGVSFYGTRIDPSVAANVKVPVLFIAGDDDPLCPVSVLQGFETSIGRGSRVVVYNGRGHGFAHRPQSPEEDADAEQAFNIMRNWVYNNLVADT